MQKGKPSSWCKDCQKQRSTESRKAKATFNNSVTQRDSSKKTTAEPYTWNNERVNDWTAGESWFIVQGVSGRKPVQARTAEEAIEKYLAIPV